jgi:hypothetical protein
LNTILEDVPEDREKESTVSQLESTVNDNHKTMDINKAHNLWGHAAEAMLKRTAISIKIRLTGKLKVCSVCIQTKSNQKGKKRSIAK